MYDILKIVSKLKGDYLVKAREGFVEADLDSTTFVYNYRMLFLEHALLASCKKSHKTLVIQHCLYLRLS